MNIEQLRSGEIDNFTYIVGCEEAKEALVIDPAGQVDRIIEYAEAKGLVIRTIFNTHHHDDHVGGNAELKERSGALLVCHKLSPFGDDVVDTRVGDGDALTVGTLSFKVIHTPGHTTDGACLYADGQLFTGDTLFVGDSGRTDLPGGNRPTLGKSIREKLMILPDDTVIWPGHDYGPTPSSTIAWEKRNNCNAGEYGYYVEG
jgi:glyoxylase-like metal-dependent hydrolase (beta-lactamase superfamily II)